MGITMEELMEGIKAIVGEEVGKLKAEMTQPVDRKEVLPDEDDLPTAPGATTIGKGPDGDWNRFGEWCKAVYRADRNRGLDPRLSNCAGISDERQKTTGHYREGVDSEGGFLVPDEYLAQLLELSIEDAVVRPLATIFPMATDSLKIPKVVETSHASSLFGGVVAYWTEEQGTKVASKSAFGQVNLRAKKLTGLTYASDELLSDSAIPMESLLLRQFASAIGWYEDNAFFNGSGVGSPLGILNSGCLISQGYETGQTADTVWFENIVKMYSRMFPGSRNRAVWVASPDVLPQILSMSITAGFGGHAIYVSQESGAAKTPPMTILGRPVYWTEHCQKVGDVGDIYFIDFSQYLIGDKQDLTIDSSIHASFTTDETCWRFVKRMDGQPWLDSAITPQNGQPTMGPFVALAARA